MKNYLKYINATVIKTKFTPIGQMYLNYTEL